MEIMTSPYRTPIDNPSRQLLYELSRLGVAAQENFYARLDRENKERETYHRDALAAAAAEHDRIRRVAENERERLELQLQAERRRREAEETRELEKRRQEKADRDAEEAQEVERKRQEKADRDAAEKRRETERAELERRKVAEEQKDMAVAAEVKRLEKERQEGDLKRRLKALQDVQAQRETVKQAEKNAREAGIATQRQQQITPNQPLNVQSIARSQTTSSVHRDPKTEAEHQRYIEIHRNLKSLRKVIMDGAQKNASFRQQVGDMRREIKKCVGQLIAGKGANKAPLQQLIATLRESLKIPGPKVDAHMFIASRPQLADHQAPALLLYFLNIFAKAVVSQFIDEAGVSPKAADAVGIVASHIFSLPDFRWAGFSWVDILIAKMHVVCPVIWGIYGDETTTEGKYRIGWWQEDKQTPTPTWVSSQEHNQRMTGLGAGFAAITLRNYEKARLENPYPSMHYWKAIATITNVPPQLVTQTHFVVLKAMIETYEQKFLEFYGNGALAALRVALVDFPQRANHQSVAAKALTGLADVLRRDMKLNL